MDRRYLSVNKTFQPKFVVSPEMSFQLHHTRLAFGKTDKTGPEPSVPGVMEHRKADLFARSGTMAF
jgi:hypothetical protein